MIEAILQTVVAPTPFQIEYWLYPFFFFMTYDILVLGFASVGGIGGKDIQWVFLEANTLASLLAVIMGMLNIMIPMFFVGAGIIVVLRG